MFEGRINICPRWRLTTLFYFSTESPQWLESIFNTHFCSQSTENPSNFPSQATTKFRHCALKRSICTTNCTQRENIIQTTSYVRQKTYTLLQKDYKLLPSAHIDSPKRLITTVHGRRQQVPKEGKEENHLKATMNYDHRHNRNIKQLTFSY